MLSIRLQRLGRKGHPVYRIVVQDSRQAPTSGKYVALLGNYDPHTKKANLVKDKAEHYLKHGAQPSERVVKLFVTEKIDLPKWVKQPTKQERKTRNSDKLRKNRPAEEPAAEPVSEAEIKPEDTTEVAEAPAEEQATAEEPKEEKAETVEASTEPEAAEKPAEESSDDKEKETKKA